MTMEDRSSGPERGTPAASTTTISSSFSDAASSDTSYSFHKVNKRTFDVAFLVAPDENLARRKNDKLCLISSGKLTEMKKDDRLKDYDSPRDYDPQETPPPKTKLHDSHRKRLSPYEDPFTCSYSSRTPISPGLSPERNVELYTQVRSSKCPSPSAYSQDSQTLLGRYVDLVEPIGITYRHSDPQGEKSAFTKVSLNPRNGFDDEQTSSRSSISPDEASYQTSASPPVAGNSAYKYCSLPAKITYPFVMGPDTRKTTLLENLKIPQVPRISSPKLSTFRPDLSQVYPNLPYNPISVFPPMSEIARPRYLTTAGLLPPSLAAFTLPAQNVCAKCNLSFRMTSDLVYHMRSHHKNETSGEAARRRREEKLRCPVCDESFRERHHLTRHMTAHQDKESDAIVDQVEVKRRTASVHGK